MIEDKELKALSKSEVTKEKTSKQGMFSRFRSKSKDPVNNQRKTSKSVESRKSETVNKSHLPWHEEGKESDDANVLNKVVRTNKQKKKALKYLEMSRSNLNLAPKPLHS